jgi:uncharacterized protein (TIGR02246 family)
MNRILIALSLSVSLLLVGSLPVHASQSQDLQAIRQVLQTQQADAWNRHDAKAYAALFTQDGDVVNVVGWWWKGRAEIERKLAAGFAFVFKNSELMVTDVDVRFINPKLAIAHTRWTMTGAKVPPGMPEPRTGIQLQVLQKQHGRWLIVSFQNTNSIPERPFPTSAPTRP